MEIVDSQVHIWGPDTPERPWRASGHAHVQRATPVTAEEVIGWMDEGGIDAAIIAQRYPGRFAVMGRVNPDSPGLRGELPAWREQPGMLGVRLALHTAELRQPLIEGRYDWMWEDLERHGIPVMVLINHSFIHMIDAIAAKHPRLKFVIDHLGLVNGEKDDVAFRGLDQLLALGKRPNVAVKSSALPCYTAEPYPYPGLQKHLKRIHDAVSLYVIAILTINAVSVVVQCGFGECHTFGYKLLQ